MYKDLKNEEIDNKFSKMKELLKINVNDYVEKKNGLNYLSWANAIQEILKIYPDFNYIIHKRDDGLPIFGNNEMGYMVYTSVIINNITRECWLPIMDYRNKSILNPTTFDINKSVMRCLTKNLAMFGLGLYIYTGEDLPEEIKDYVDVDLEIKQKIESINTTEELSKYYKDNKDKVKSKKSFHLLVSKRNKELKNENI